MHRDEQIQTSKRIDRVQFFQEETVLDILVLFETRFKGAQRTLRVTVNLVASKALGYAI